MESFREQVSFDYLQGQEEYTRKRRGQTLLWEMEESSSSEAGIQDSYTKQDLLGWLFHWVDEGVV